MPNIQKYMPLSPTVEKAISQNKQMIKALKNKGLDLVDIAGYLKKMIGCEKPYFDQQEKETRDIPDNANRNKALDMAIHIVDVLPSVRHEIEENRNINIHITTLTTKIITKVFSIQFLHRTLTTHALDIRNKVS